MPASATGRHRPLVVFAVLAVSLLRRAVACRGRDGGRVLSRQADPLLHHGQPGRRLRHLYACAGSASGKEAWRQDATDERAGGGRPDGDEPAGECAGRWAEHPSGRWRDTGNGATLRSSGRQLRCPQADLAGAAQQRGEGHVARAEVALPHCRRHGAKPAAGDLGGLGQDRRQCRLLRDRELCARPQEQDHHRLQGHRRHESRDPARRGRRPGRLGGIRRALRREQRHAGRCDTCAQARGAVSRYADHVRGGLARRQAGAPDRLARRHCRVWAG